MDSNTIDNAIERGFESTKQPRYISPERFFQEIARMSIDALNAPPRLQNGDGRYRDRWMFKFLDEESHLSGILNSVVQIDMNRRWKLTGSERQVRRYANRLANFAGGTKRSWREFISMAAMSYYVTDLGYVAEIEREVTDSEVSPMLSMYSVDPTRCLLTGDWRYPLIYEPVPATASIGLNTYGSNLAAHDPARNNLMPNEFQAWRASDFIHSNAMPSPREEERGLGHSAVGRSLTLAQIMVGMYKYQLEKLDVRPPLGYFVTSIPKKIFDNLQDEQQDAQADMGQYFRGTYAIMGADKDELMRFVALSEMPDELDPTKFTEVLMKGISLNFGYPVQEFYTISGANIAATSSDTRVQTEMATTKGEMAFALSMQEDIQRELPASLMFTYEQRNDAGVKVRAETEKLISETANILYGLGRTPGQPEEEGAAVLTRAQMEYWLAERGVIPREWSADITDVEEANLRRMRREMRDKPQVRFAAAAFPSEPIIEFEYPTNRERIIWESGTDVLKREYYPVAVIARETLLEDEDADITITDADIDALIELSAEWDSALKDYLNAPLVEDEEDAN